MPMIREEHLNELKGNELKLLIHLQIKACGADHISITIEAIHEFMKPTSEKQMCTRTINRIVKSLVDKGYLRKEWPGGPVPATYYFIK